jgi:hypothetical protein
MEICWSVTTAAKRFGASATNKCASSWASCSRLNLVAIGRQRCRFLASRSRGLRARLHAVPRFGDQQYEGRGQQSAARAGVPRVSHVCYRDQIAARDADRALQPRAAHEEHQLLTMPSRHRHVRRDIDCEFPEDGGLRDLSRTGRHSQRLLAVPQQDDAVEAGAAHHGFYRFTQSGEKVG